MEERKKLLLASLSVITKEKLRKFVEMKDLTESQSAVCQKNEEDTLLESMRDLIAAKQNVIEDINALNENYKRIYNQLGSLIGFDKLEADFQNPDLDIKINLEKCKEIMGEIQKIDTENTKIMQDNFNQVELQLRKLKQGKKVALSYEGAYGRTDASFVDKKR